MQTTIDDTGVIQKTRDLCQSIIEQPEFRQIRQRVEAFMADQTVKDLYQRVVEKGDALQQKQQFGVPMDNAEVAAFEQDREQLLNSAVAREFLEAQQQMHQIQESVMQYVGKTFELGRVPMDEDFSSGGCGSSCGCH